MKLLFAVSALLAVVVPEWAWASTCRLTQIIVPGVTAAYDPFETTTTASPVTFSVQTEGNCRGGQIEIAVSATQASPRAGPLAILANGGETVSATILAGGQARPIAQMGAPFTTNPLLLPLGATGQVQGNATLALSLEAGQVAGPGTYSATYDLVARLTDSDGQRSVLRSPINVSTIIRPSVRVAVGAGDLTMDLGELKPGIIGGPVNFDAYANVDYSMVLRSENGFSLRRDGAAAATLGVPYSPLLTGATLTNGRGDNVQALRSSVFDVPRDGLRHHSLRIRIDAFGRLAAGHYSDVLTLEIRARV